MAELTHNHYVALAYENFTDGQNVLVIEALKRLNLPDELFRDSVFGSTDFHSFKSDNLVISLVNGLVNA